MEAQSMFNPVMANGEMMSTRGPSRSVLALKFFNIASRSFGFMPPCTSMHLISYSRNTYVTSATCALA